MSNTHKILTEEDQISIIQPSSSPQTELTHLPSLMLAQKLQINRDVKKVNSTPSDMIGLITHQIESEIQKSHITISDEQKPFSLVEKHNSSVLNNDLEKYDQKKVAQFVKKRKDLEEQIRRLKLQQEEQKNKSRSKSPQLDTTHKNFRSNYTSQEQLEISRIIKKSEQFQNQIQTKDKLLAKSLQAQRLKKEEQHRMYLEKLKEKKKQQALKKIQKLHEQQKERTQKIKEENKKFQEVKKTKALHQKIQEHDKLFEQQKKQQQFEILKQKRQSMTFNFEEIKNHQRKYYETFRMSKEKIENQLFEKIQKMKQEQQLLSQTYRPSKFLLTLWSQEKQKEEMENERIERMKNLYNKKSDFQQKLRDIHKQKIKTKPKPEMKKSIIDQKLQDHKLKVKSMSAADIYRQGQQYMKSVHASITPTLAQQTKIEIQNNYSSLKSGVKPLYRNYLQEQKMRKEFKYKSTGKLGVRENPEIHELQNLIERKKENANYKLEKAKMIAQKLDRKAKNASTAALIDSISAKLKIIEEFS